MKLFPSFRRPLYSSSFECQQLISKRNFKFRLNSLFAGFISLCYTLFCPQNLGFMHPMEKVNLTKQFAYRLRDAMIDAGFNSQRSTSGVCIHKLAEITGYSLQICRKYLRGEAIPEPTKLIEIAAKLQVAPGWLLFGDAHNSLHVANTHLNISKNLLRYIFTRAACLYNGALQEVEIPDFLMDLIKDVSLINANEEQSKKIIDLAFSSIKHFSHPHGT